MGLGAALVAGALLWGVGAAPAYADSVREAQWPLQNYGADSRVWPISQGEGVTVALIDSGVLADHQDLTGQILPGTDLSGQQGDGRVDVNGHGTSMASIIAGHGHDGQSGVMGLASKAKILPIRVALSDSGEANSGETKLAEGIRYAADHGAKVINLSVSGGSASDRETRAAVEYAISKDTVVIAGAGNLGKHGTPVSYPAAYPGVVAVSAVDSSGRVWNESNAGPEMTLAAPGVAIASAGIKSSTAYVTSNGTSDATAYVSAIAALVRAKYPELSAGQVINRMIKSAVAPPDKSAVPNNNYGYGIASPAAALAANPAVDGGPKENPLLGRAESQKDSTAPGTAQPAPKASGSAGAGAATGATAGNGSQAEKKDDGGVPVAALVGGAVGLLLVVGLVLFLVRRSRGGSGGPGGSGGAGGTGGGPGGPVPQSAPGYAYPPQQQAAPYPAQAQQYPAQQYPPQQPPAPPGGNPYQR